MKYINGTKIKTRFMDVIGRDLEISTLANCVS
jgi:ATP-dependent Zn protease